MLLEKFKEFKILFIVAGILIIILAVFGFLAIKNKSISKETPVSGSDTISLQPQINDEGGVSIEANPVNFDINNPRFQISFTTHQGDLDFNLTDIATLIVDGEKEYLPVQWDGGRGGHHLSGILSFPALSKNIKNMKLVVKDVYGIAAREFFWILP